MQCVKLRSVMGSYLNIHLNLFPIYVLLLLLTLSHGRPSAKVRETKGDLQKSQRQQFRDKWNPISNISPSNINSVSNEYSGVVYNNIQPISHVQNTDQQVSIVTSTTAEKFDRKEEGATRATGSQKDANHPVPKSSTKVHTAVGLEKADAHAEGFPTDAHSHIAPHAPQGSATVGEENKGNDHANSWPASLDSIYDDGISKDRHAANIEKREILSESKLLEEKATNSVVEDNLVETEGELGSQQQHIEFRRNILRSLGHNDNNELEEIPANGSMTINHMDTLTKYNISKEEYLNAYTEYMANVKKRRLANRDLIGVKDRRRNAVTIAKTYHDNGTDLFSIGRKVLKLFRFDIQYTPTMEGTDVRILRVVLNLPAMCKLTENLSNNTDLPDLQELSELAAMDEDCVDEGCADGNETEKEEVTQVDLTRNVTSWSIRSRTSSPFIVMAICSRDADSHETPSAPHTQQQHHRRHSHHGSSLKVVTKEFMKPSFEAQIKRRSRRAATSEPSTLRSFNHKRDMGRGRECANTRHGKTCCRRSLKIKFSDLGISDVILEPQEFDAHVCDGRCNARRVAYASTHAMFQHILHQTKGKKFAPRPCCVPTALSELDVLHVDPNGNRNGGPKLIVTILKDAIVKECGCS